MFVIDYEHVFIKVFIEFVTTYKVNIFPVYLNIFRW